jgi:hypothetical protein
VTILLAMFITYLISRTIEPSLTSTGDGPDTSSPKPPPKAKPNPLRMVANLVSENHKGIR